VKTYPLSLVHLDQVRCVVVGGGQVAARKVAALREADAHVLVIAPDLCPALERLAEESDVEVLGRPYQSGDLEGAFLVIAATDDPGTNEQVWIEADAREILVNVVDDPDHCNFIAPSVVRRGPLTVAISTSGRCPALSRRIRIQLEQAFGPAYGDFVALMGELRAEAVEALSLTRRRVFWQELFESDVLSLLASGDEETARSLAWRILERNVAGDAR
jgi:precorrin-2 dehydrogenase/sirohydrochlorin ferrochelatase